MQAIYKVLDILSVEDLDEWWPHKCGYTAFPGVTFFQVFNWNVNLDTSYEMEVWT